MIEECVIVSMTSCTKVCVMGRSRRLFGNLENWVDKSAIKMYSSVSY